MANPRWYDPWKFAAVDWKNRAVAAEARLAAVEAVLGWRERELLDLKGPCSNKRCRLHYAHSGSCDTQRVRAAARGEGGPADHIALFDGPTP